MAASGGGTVVGDAVLAGAGDIQAPAEVFNNIFVVFLGLGTLVGVVVITYTLYNAYKYRYREDDDPAPNADRPELGELPSGGGKGKKLFLSFFLSAVIVLSLIVWTYASLLYIENPSAEAGEASEDALNVTVEGYQFGWDFIYPNGHTTSTLYVPTDRMIRLNVTSRDVMHTFGIPEYRVKSDAMPDRITDAWFVADEPGTNEAICYELCGTGHSYMTTQVEAMESGDFQNWYEGTNETAGNETAGNQTADGSTGNETAGDQMGNETAGDQMGNETAGDQMDNETAGDQMDNETAGNETAAVEPFADATGAGRPQVIHP